MRVWRFTRGVFTLARKHLLSRHNVRAIWYQSEPGWMDKHPVLDMTDEEWELWESVMQRN